MSGRPTLGIDVTEVITAAEISSGLKKARFPVGFRTEQDGTEYVYVTSGGTIGAKVPVKFATGFSATASGATGQIDGVSGATALASGDYAFVAVRGLVEDANVASSVAAGELLARLTDANGDFVETIDVDEGGATAHSLGQIESRAKAFTTHSGGVADVYLF